MVAGREIGWKCATKHMDELGQDGLKSIQSTIKQLLRAQLQDWTTESGSK